MDLDYLRQLREIELRRVLPDISPGSLVLEVGAGAGWQLRLLREHGCTCYGIELPGSFYEMDQVAPVLTYDGARIPFADGVFDIVFSSNVLKHIADLERVQEELKRVLKDDGIAIHIVPSGTWRFWTNVAHPVFLLKHLFSYVTRRPQIWSAEDKAIHSDPVAAPDGRYSLVFPDRHGETGNFLTEIYYFSRFRWDGLFVKTGWRIAKRQANRLFYTGYVLTGLKLSWRLRELMALVLGSACHLYVLRKSTQTS